MLAFLKCFRRFRIVVIAATLVPVTLGCRSEVAPETSRPTDAATTADADFPSPEQQTKAMAAKDALFTRLSSRLMEVMSTEGPLAAIEVCSQEATQIADQVGQEQGVRIGRTALKKRNPNNVPPEWAVASLADAREMPKFVSLEDGAAGALLPIKLQAQCLMCHGPPDQIFDEVRTQIARLYPDDQATGFHEGDLRGWFWVEVP